MPLSSDRYRLRLAPAQQHQDPRERLWQTGLQILKHERWTGDKQSELPQSSARNPFSYNNT